MRRIRISTLELVWLILVHIYALMSLLIDDHPNIVQMTHVLIDLSYVGIIEPNSWSSGLGECHLLIDPIWWFCNSLCKYLCKSLCKFCVNPFVTPLFYIGMMPWLVWHLTSLILSWVVRLGVILLEIRISWVGWELNSFCWLPPHWIDSSWLTMVLFWPIELELSYFVL